MNQKILSEIKTIASEIAETNDIETSILKNKISKLYDKLVVLEYLENSISDIENNEVEKNIISTEEEVAVEEIIVEEEETINITDTLEFSKTEEEVSEPKETEEKEEVVADEVEQELETIDEVEDIDKTIEEVSLEKDEEALQPKKSSLHEELKKNTIQIGLNDRIAFVKRLFDGNQQDFHRVLSQVNTFTSLDEVQEFIETMVKPEYNWDNQEEYADRFLEIIEAKFL